eukprot:763243-Hanusia_phi.AAC.4
MGREKNGGVAGAGAEGRGGGVDGQDSANHFHYQIVRTRKFCAAARQEFGKRALRGQEGRRWSPKSQR